MKRIAVVAVAALATVVLAQEESKLEQTLKEQSAAADGMKLDGTPVELAKGRALFEKHCASCHTFRMLKTSNLGPDLSDVGTRLKKQEILESLIFPSRVIADKFKASIVETKDGDFLNGIITRKTATSITVEVGQNQKAKIIPSSKVKLMRPSSTSIMPNGLTDEMSKDDVSNLVGFLMSPMPKAISPAKPKAPLRKSGG